MNNIKTFSVSETALNIIAILLTVGDLLYRGSLMLLKKTASFFIQLICILSLAAAILLAYLIFMAIFTATGPWINTNIQ